VVFKKKIVLQSLFSRFAHVLPVIAAKLSGIASKERRVESMFW
jgi:hypothetical protein